MYQAYVLCSLPVGCLHSLKAHSTLDVFCYEAHCWVPAPVFLSTKDEAIESNLYHIYCVLFDFLLAYLLLQHL